MTKNQQAIILVSIIGTILSEYDEQETTPAIRDLKRVCKKFMDAQSGVKVLPFYGPRIVNQKRHDHFVNTVKIGDRIWRETLEKYIDEKLTIDAISIIMAVYQFAPDILASKTKMTKQKMEAYAKGGSEGDEKHKTHGCIVGGHLVELLSKEMGIKINGRLKALKAKVERDIKAA